MFAMAIISGIAIMVGLVPQSYSMALGEWPWVYLLEMIPLLFWGGMEY